MNSSIDFTHDPAARSWVESANAPDTDFPLQNLPLGRFRRRGDHHPAAWRIGIAIGDQVLDFRKVAEAKIDLGVPLGALERGVLNAFLATGPERRQQLRHAVFNALGEDSPLQGALQRCLVPQSAIELSLPCRIGDYTDFYTGIHHATAVGKLFRPDQPLLPNYKHVPIGYHGRASSIVVSGTEVTRPRGQLKGPQDELPRFAPCERLDHELELGAFIATGNELGAPLSMEQAEAALAGLVLLNDWSARDMQAWEYQPLGPFLAKNFATTISPWLVTMEALAPFRAPFERPAGDPQPLPYLDGEFNRGAGSIDIALEVFLSSAAMREQGLPALRISQSNFRDAYWTLAQMVAHHASNGCNLQPGDLLGTGTQSGPGPGQGGSMLELSQGGKVALTLPDGSERRFLQDGDELTLRARCERPGARRIGFGACAGIVLPAA
ncbi:fumarylacetoacetase [Rivibacter subsaxonicus]|uniref:fumarylacetoacetase n=1 Tax=Rivibacter subsaxonicus TaxID=457575 RepID=A0A4Q7W0R2_9BURK|nr:fumarylacetoacetase [Rivibacter subsaxonicus]RZU02478.1 fumarylacetoacetate hydrolase [Rivibacter subsaxonicus]